MSNPHEKRHEDARRETYKGVLMEQRVLYTRSEDGCDPVVIQESGGTVLYTLERPESPLVFPTARQLLIAVTNHPEARHWTLDRYFRLGRHAPLDRVQDNPILEAFGPGGWAIEETSLTTTGGLVRVRSTRKNGTGREDGLGIDLTKRGKEVVKLLFAGFSGMIRSGRYDPEDVLQEVFKGILVRNQGSCPFDPRKASFGHYVHMVCRCVLSNYHRRTQRYRSTFQEGLPGWNEDGELGILDVGDDHALGAINPIPAENTSEELAYRDTIAMLGKSPQRTLALKVLPLLRDGLERQEIADSLGETKASVVRACAYLRTEIRRRQESYL